MARCAAWTLTASRRSTPRSAAVPSPGEAARSLGVQLPEGGADATRRRLARRFPHAGAAEPAPSIRAVIAAIQAMLRGERVDLSDVPVALEALPEFDRAVYARARAIPFGRVATYGEIAADHR